MRPFDLKPSVLTNAPTVVTQLMCNWYYMKTLQIFIVDVFCGLKILRISAWNFVEFDLENLELSMNFYFAILVAVLSLLKKNELGAVF